MTLNNPRFATTVTAGVTHPLEADITHSAPVTTTECFDICYRARNIFSASPYNETVGPRRIFIVQLREFNVLRFLRIVVKCVFCSINSGYSCYSFRNIRIYHCRKPKRLKCGALHVCILYSFICFGNLVSSPHSDVNTEIGTI